MHSLYHALLTNISEEYHELAPSYENFVSRVTPTFLNRVSPISTLSISVTGKSCCLKCSHCEGHYLNGMANISDLSKYDLNKYKSILISGGSDTSGRVPLSEFSESILKFPDNITFNFHVGFQSIDCLEEFKDRKLIVSFDLPGSDDAISNVFHLPYKTQEYQKLYLSYASQYVTIPHMTIGLNGGTHSGEEDTIEFLGKNQPDQFVVIIFRPTKNTAFENTSPPSIKRVLFLLKLAQEKLNGPIKIGCMRPSGAYRQNIDTLAWMIGIKSIVHPHNSLVKMLEKNSIKIKTTDECCAFSQEIRP